jgi:S-formylglutathione hydrolase FrmB
MLFCKMKRAKSLLFLLFTILVVKGATVDTITTYSPSMDKRIKAVVIIPMNYENLGKWPVAYLLHGYSGNYADWLIKAPDLKKYADLYNMIIVCPDGGFSSWYFDSKVDPTMKYETYISSELIRAIDLKYKTIPTKGGRAIAGFSMGGHGALYLAFRHQDVFGVVGSSSGGVDLSPFVGNWDISKRLGEFDTFSDQWENNSVINMTDMLTEKSLSIIFDCGTEDFFYSVNLALHEKLQKNHISHDFISRPGGHTAEYWANAIKYQLLFMSDYFNRQ